MLELRYALRRLRRTPSLAGVIVATLALGIGSSWMVLAAVRGAYSHTLPFPRPSELAVIGATGKVDQSTRISILSADEWAARSRSFFVIAPYIGASLTVRVGDQLDQVYTATVTPAFFRALEVTPLVGRVIEFADDRTGAEPVVVLSHAAWQRYYEGRKSILDERVTLNDRTYRVVGVMPEGFVFPARTGGMFGWIPLADQYDAMKESDSRVAHAIGRLGPGMSVRTADREIRAFGMRTKPGSMGLKDATPFVRSLSDSVFGEVRGRLVLMAAAACLIALLVYASVGSLLFAQAMARLREFAVRFALGASPWQIVRQPTTEAVMLGLTGAALGLVLAAWGLTRLREAMPGTLPEAQHMRLDLESGAAALALTLVMAAALALATWRVSRRRSVVDTLRDGGSSAGRSELWLRRSLLAVEIMATVVLLSGAGLLVRTVVRLATSSPGYAADGVLSAGVTRPYAIVMGAEAQEIRAWVHRMTEALNASGAFVSAAMASDVPGKGAAFQVQAHLPEQTLASPGYAVGVHSITAGYFATLGIPILAGTTFRPTDDEHHVHAIVIDETLARRAFGRESAVGRRLRLDNFGYTAEIVGVVGATRQFAMGWESSPSVYVPLAQLPVPRLTVLVRQRSAVSGAASLRRIVHEVDPNQPLGDLEPLTAVIERAEARPRFYLWLLLTFGAIALVVTGLGLYGMISLSVTQRTRELGIRAALGAETRRLVVAVLKDTIRVTAIGLAVGAVLAWMFLRFLTTLLEGLGTESYSALAAGVLLCAALIVAATLRPALRAARIRPSTALGAD
ncbi:MAG: ABC transporter permease [Gemmatimonadaceae bacterium]